MYDMAREHIASIRVSDNARDTVHAIAAALSTEDAKVTASDVYRTLLTEAVTARRRACTPSHKGPVKDQICANCGGATR
jgi:hypothetical protein